MEKINTHLSKAGLRPISVQSVLYFYLPMKGSVSYAVLGSQMLSPEMYEKFSFLIIPKYISLTNACLANSLIGSGLYIYSRKHLKSSTETCKVAYSAFGSTIFNLGSVLGWALCRNTIFGDDSSSTFGGTVVRAAIGGATAICAVKLAHCYLKTVDNATTVKKD